MYGFGRRPDYFKWRTPLEYHLLSTDREPKGARGRVKYQFRWTQEIPLVVRAMALAGGTLFIAGPPDLVDEESACRQYGQQDVQEKLTEQAAALRGEKGAVLWAVSTANGKKLGGLRLEALPRWDGMAAAHGNIYLATVDGRVICLSGK